MDNLLLEKKLLITRNQPQNRKYVPSRDDIAESMYTSFTLFSIKLERPAFGFVNRPAAICFFGLLHAPTSESSDN